MAKYTVIKYFTDLQDNRHAYNVGDTYPRKDLKPDEARIAELSGSNNKQGQPLIKLVEEDKGEKSLEKMKKDELQAYAEEKGIDLGDANTKDEIIAKIKEAEAEAQVDPEPAQ